MLPKSIRLTQAGSLLSLLMVFRSATYTASILHLQSDFSANYIVKKGPLQTPCLLLAASTRMQKRGYTKDNV